MELLLLFFLCKTLSFQWIYKAHNNLMATKQMNEERKRNISSNEPFFKSNSSQLEPSQLFPNDTWSRALFHRFLCCFSSNCYCALTKGNAATFSLSTFSCYWTALLCFLLCLVPYRFLYKEPWPVSLWFPSAAPSCCWSIARVAIQKQ